MTTWTDADLARYGGAEEVRVAGMRRDGSLRTPRIVWVVRVGDELYTRSVNGPDAAWFRGVQARHRGQLSAGHAAADVDFVDGSDRADDDAIDAAYQRKYRRYPGPVKSITSATARSTTRRACGEPAAARRRNRRRPEVEQRTGTLTAISGWRPRLSCEVCIKQPDKSQ